MSDAKKCKCPHLSSAIKEAQGDSADVLPHLPKREIAFYLVALLSIITYAGYGFYLTYGQDPETSLPLPLLRQGWMRKYKDLGDDSLLDNAAGCWKFFLLMSLGYLAVSKITLMWMPMAWHHIACSVFTLIMTGMHISPAAAIAMVASYFVALCMTYYSYTVLFLVVVFLIYLHNTTAVLFTIISLLRLDDSKASKYAASFGYLMCRYISMSHSLHSRLSQRKQKGEPVPTLLEYLRDNLPLTLHYAFYMPYQWAGPILTYDMFKEQVERRGRNVSVDRSAAVWAVWRSCRMLVWFFVLQLFHHFLPVSSYLQSLVPEDQIVYKHLAFAMFLHGQNFMLTYVQFYGWPAVVAKLDGIQLLDWPDCISWIYSYSIMWRVFDRGLAAVLREHVHIPLSGNKRGFLRQLLGASACFAFICVFHGDTSNIRAWVACNLIQLMTEKLVVSVYNNHLKSAVRMYLSPQNESRLIGYVIGWNMMVSCSIIFLFLAGLNGFIVFPEFLLLRSNSHSPVWHMLTMQFAAYCAVQIGRFYQGTFRGHACRGKVRED